MGGIPSPCMMQEGQSQLSMSKGSQFCSSHGLGVTNASFPQGFSSVQHRKTQRENATLPTGSTDNSSHLSTTFFFFFFFSFSRMQNEAK